MIAKEWKHMELMDIIKARHSNETGRNENSESGC